MKSEAPTLVIETIPAVAREPVTVQSNKIPLAAKLAVTAFLAVLLPVYLHAYGPTNFLWFCDAALLLTVRFKPGTCSKRQQLETRSRFT